jgi:hypothetical protein
MDSNQTLREILEFLEQLSQGNEEARPDAVERLRSLAHWLERGGFAPAPKAFTKGGNS